MKRTYFIPKGEKNIQVHMKFKNIKSSTQHPLFVLYLLQLNKDQRDSTWHTCGFVHRTVHRLGTSGLG
jgi:hypothetical protein